MAATPPHQYPGTATAAEEQIRPLAPAANGHSHRVDVENGEASREKNRRRQKCLKCCGCCSVVTLIIVLVLIILALTVFRVKDPKIRMESIQIDGLSSLTNNINTLNTNVNLTLFAGISVKNPNAASFKFDEATTSLIYGGRVVGEAETPPGNARARRTLRMNVTIHVMVQSLVGVTSLPNDLLTGELPVAISTRIHGKAKVLGFIKKSATVRMNCTMSFDISSQQIEDLDCNRKVSL